MPQTVETDFAIDLGVLSTEPAEEYHAKAAEHLGSHALIDYIECPWLYRKKQLGLIQDTDTPALLVGRATHVRILEAATPTNRSSPSAVPSIPARRSPSARPPRPLPSGPRPRASPSSLTTTSS